MHVLNKADCGKNLSIQWKHLIKFSSLKVAFGYFQRYIIDYVTEYHSIVLIYRLR